MAQTNAVGRYLLLVNGPNLNRLGTREPDIYGTDTLADVEARVRAIAAGAGVEVKSVQSNHEGALVDAIQQEGPDALGIVLNPGALAHYGYSLRDCLADVPTDTVEVHISNVHGRDPFRHELVLAPVVVGQIVGLGTYGYELAAQFFLRRSIISD